MDTYMHNHSMPLCRLLIHTNIKNQTTSKYDFMHIQPFYKFVSRLFHITSQHWYHHSQEQVLTQVTKIVMNNFENKNFKQMMQRLTMHSSGPNFIFWVMRAGRDFSPDVRTCFHQVPKRFQRAPQVPKLFHHDVPSSTSVLCHMLSPEFKFHGYNLGRGN